MRLPLSLQRDIQLPIVLAGRCDQHELYVYHWERMALLATAWFFLNKRTHGRHEEQDKANEVTRPKNGGYWPSIDENELSKTRSKSP